MTQQQFLSRRGLFKYLAAIPLVSGTLTLAYKANQVPEYRLRYICRTAGTIHLFYSPKPLPRLPLQSCVIDTLGLCQRSKPSDAYTPPNGMIHHWQVEVQGDECIAKLYLPPLYHPRLAKKYWDQLS